MSPSDLELHTLHDRYLIDVVEALGLCPFAVRARDQDEVVRVLIRFDAPLDNPAPQTSEPWHAPTLWVPADTSLTASDVAHHLAKTASAYPKAAVVLLTFILSEEHPWQERYAFDRMMQDASSSHRLAQQKLAADVRARFYMACFHPTIPESPSDTPMTASRLVHLIRQSPDPVIQAIRADTMDALRVQHRRQMRTRMKHDLQQFPADIAALISQSPDATKSLSDTIDANNFKRTGPLGPDHALLLERLREIHEARRLM